MKITRIRQVYTPQVGEKESVGYDFFIPNFDSKFIKSFKTLNNGKELDKSNNKLIIRVYPHEIVKIPTGIKIKMKRFKLLNFFFKMFGIKFIPKLQAYDKSSLSSKGLKCLAGLIDYSYRGEIIAVITNLSTDTEIDLPARKKFIQFVQEFAFVTPTKEVNNEKFTKQYKTERNTGGFGSTDTK